VTMVQMPGLNTPQFGWVRTSLRRQPRPVPPVFQPEVAADAILRAADRPRRERWVGAMTAAVIIGNRLAPALADRYLARTNVEGQQTGDPIDPDRPDYVFEPLPGDRGAHGLFDSEAKTKSLMVELADRPAAAGAIAAAGGVLVGAVARRLTD